MSHWIALLVAVAANVAANIAFKSFVQNADLGWNRSSFFAAIAQPTLWMGLGLGIVLLGTYLYALKAIPISVAYTAATTLSIVAVTTAGILIYGEAFGPRLVLGVATVIVGVGLITTA